jgi:ribonuclease P protein component
MPQKGHGFTKEERLCSLKEIEDLFNSGNVLFSYPFRLIWKEAGKDILTPAKIVIAVPKRNFKKAVHRNLIRRRIKEAYRKQKEILYNPLSEKGVSIVFMMQYTGKEIATYSKLVEGVAGALKKMAVAVCSTV